MQKKGGFIMDHIPEPTVKNIIRINGFTLYAYSYRPLTRAECCIARDMYKQQTHIKKFPTSGSGKIFTLFGYNPEDDL